MNVFLIFICEMSIAMVLSGCSSSFWNGRQFDPVSSEDVRSTFAILLHEDLSVGDNDKEVQCAKDVDGAVEMFDKYIFPTLEDKSSNRVESLRSRITDGRSWMYCVAERDFMAYYFLNLYPEMLFGRYAFGCYISYFDLAKKQFYPMDPGPLENFGFLEMRTQDSDMNPILTYEEMVNRLPLLKWNGVFDVDDDKCDAVAVVDIVDVQLSEVSGFDRVRRYNECTFFGGECCAVYRIHVFVRKVEKGSLAFDSFVIEKRIPWSDFFHEGAWFYYRGMTLRVELRNKNGAWLISDAHPALPYPPYSDEGVVLSGGVLHAEKEWSEIQRGGLTPLIVEYGHHTKVEFSCGDVVCQSPSGSFVDFGVTSKFKVLELKDGGNKQFWNYAWFMQKGEEQVK